MVLPQSVVQEPIIFIAEVAEAANTIIWKGQRIEYFLTAESPASVTTGQRVRCMHVPECGQVFILQVIT